MIIDEQRGTEIAANLRQACGLDFVGISVVPPNPDTTALSWNYVSGNTNDRYRRIFLPAGVGVLGFVLDSRQALVVEDVETDIAPEDLYQYPIVAAEGLESFVAFPLYDNGTIALICTCASRTRHAVTPADVDRMRSLAEKASGLTAGGESTVTPPLQSSRGQYGSPANMRSRLAYDCAMS